MRWLTFVLCTVVAMGLLIGCGKKTTDEDFSGEATSQTKAGGNVQTEPQVAE